MKVLLFLLFISIGVSTGFRVRHPVKAPYIVTFEKTDEDGTVNNMGGGVLLNASVLITTAEVLAGFKYNDVTFQVRAGAFPSNLLWKSEKRLIQQVYGICYDPVKEDPCDHHDIAIVVLNTPFRLTKHIHPYALPRKLEPVPGKGTPSKLVSFFMTPSGVIIHLTNAVIEEPAVCEEHLHKQVAFDQFCAEVMLPQVDAGVPFLVNGTMLGLGNTSHMNKKATHFYGVMTSIEKHRDWIYEKVHL